MNTENTKTEASASLAERVVACKGWRWMAGMLSFAGWRCYDVGSYPSDSLDAVNTEDGDIDSQWTGPGERLHGFDDPATLALPDLDDPATVGCLLALVRQAWGEPDAHPMRTVRGMGTVEASGWRPDDAIDLGSGGWQVLKWSINRGRGGFHDMLAGYHNDPIAALVAALEAAS